MRTVNLTNLSTGEPLFSLEDVNNLISFTAMVLSKAVKDSNYNVDEWHEYIRHWCESNCMPQEVFEHLDSVIELQINNLRHNG